MAKLVYEADVAGGSKVQFIDYKQAAAWIAAELAFWAWLEQVGQNRVGSETGYYRNLLSWLQNSRQSALQLHQGSPQDQRQVKDQFASELNRYVASGLTSSTELAQFIQRVREEHGETVAASTLLAAFGVPLRSDQPQAPFARDVLIGRTLYAHHVLGISEKTGKAARSALAKVAEDFRSQLNALTSETLETEKLLKETNAKISADRAAEEERVSKLFHETATSQTARVEAAVKALEDTEERFRIRMKTEAPVQYWATKAGEHEWHAMLYGITLSVYAIVASVGLAFLYYWVHSEALRIVQLATNEKSMTGALLVLTAGTAVGTTILLWVGRFLQRMFLSERHMGIDARLRATLALTYLAMSDRDKVGEADRAIVLPALFRAGADGIVQEDSNIDGLLAMFAKYLERPRG